MVTRVIVLQSRAVIGDMAARLTEVALMHKRPAKGTSAATAHEMLAVMQRRIPWLLSEIATK
jgi:hypothetical protein